MKCPICGRDVEMQKKQAAVEGTEEPVIIQYAVCRNCKKRWKLDKQRAKKETAAVTEGQEKAGLAKDIQPVKETQPVKEETAVKEEMPVKEGQHVKKAEAAKEGRHVQETKHEKEPEEPEDVPAAAEEDLRDDSAQKGKKHRRKKKKSAGKIVLIILLIFLILFGGAACAFFYLRTSGKDKIQEAAGTAAPVIGDEDGLVYRNGKKYRYNEEIVTLLFMGIDTDTDLSQIQEASLGNGQADTIFLMALNPVSDTIRLVGISRDTMTEISTYDYYGNYIGESVNHLGLGYAFGPGGMESGKLMVDAVSNLFYGLPIHGFCAVNMNAIGKINDAVGGVTVTLPMDMQLGGNVYSQGQSVRLMGDEAKSFVRHRDEAAAGSNNERMSRQKQYAAAFFSAAKTAFQSNITLPVTLYNELSAEMVTSLTLNETVYLATEAAGMSLNMDEIQMVEGTVQQGEIYEEFYVDETALEDLIIDIFYSEVR